jgi:hypothetical protein
MAKKKAKKKATRKSVPKKRTGARKPAKKTAAKSRRTTRKAAVKAKRRPAAAKKSAPRKTTAPRGEAGAKQFTVDPNQCKITATAACTVEFSNPSLLGLNSPSLGLVKGPNGPYEVQVEVGLTKFWITACISGAGSDPSDIIVP